MMSMYEDSDKNCNWNEKNMNSNSMGHNQNRFVYLSVSAFLLCKLFSLISSKKIMKRELFLSDG